MQMRILQFVATIGVLAAASCGPTHPTDVRSAAGSGSGSPPPPPGYTLSGQVTAAATGGPLWTAQVWYTKGAYEDVTFTDATGAYMLTGVTGPLRLRVVLDGFTTQSRDVTVSSNTMADFALDAVTPPGADLTGAWTAAFSVSRECRDKLPANVRDLQYDATITQQGAQFVVTLTSPTIYTDSTPTGSFPLFGTLSGHAATLVIAGDTGYDGWSTTHFEDHVSSTEAIGIDGGATGDATPAGSRSPELRMVLSGDFVYWVSPRNSAPNAYCRATDHALVLRRK